jgi:hypothetical protein
LSVRLGRRPEPSLSATRKSRGFYLSLRTVLGDGGLKLSWVILVPVVLTAVLLIVLFAPVVLDPNFRNGGSAMVCGPNAPGSHTIVCTSFVQYDSIAYAYGGWGAYFQTGVNYYTIQGWMCFEACVAPFGGIIWGLVAALLSADFVSLVFVTRLRSAPASC